MRAPRLYLGTMTFGWSQTSSKIDEGVAVEMVEAFVKWNARCRSDDDNNKHHHHIDTARIYAGGKTESVVGYALSNVNGNNLAVGTKAHPSQPGGLSSTGIQEQFQASATAMGVSYFEEYYLHQPDPEHTLLESLQCLHEYREKGLVKAVGMSNYHASEMERAFSLCKEHGLTPPTIYQGLYNPLNRAVEKELLPILRKNNCSFIAYNPLAAGLLTGKHSPDNEKVPHGRFKDNQNYLPRFYTDVNFQAMELIRKACDEEGMTMVQATYQWLLCHSALSAENNDGVLLGASSLSQLEQNLAACEVALHPNCDPLPQKLLQAFDKAWTLTQSAAVFPYWRNYSSDMPNRENLDQGASYDAAKKK